MKTFPPVEAPQAGVLALTMGDPAGIGLDITLKAWTQRVTKRLPPFVLYANADETRARARLLGLDVPVACVASPGLARGLFGEALPLIDIPLAATVDVGAPASANGAGVLASIDQAVTDTVDGLAIGVVTNPISKATLYDAGFSYPGHTEYLAHLSECLGGGSEQKPVMMLACEQLRVIPLTVHIPLRDVADSISEDLIVETARIAQNSLKMDFGVSSPRLAITGLNPHAGENDALGKEDSEIIKPAIARLLSAGLEVTGPHPADTLFHESARKSYDAVIAMYHDQALIPIKTLAFDSGVNVTVVLSMVRTSPDHGTAFDIAGTGMASPESLIASLKMAFEVALRRAAAKTLIGL